MAPANRYWGSIGGKCVAVQKLVVVIVPFESGLVY